MTASTCASTDTERKLLELCSTDVGNFSLQELQEVLTTQQLRVDATDENGMTGLMHAAYRGNSEACKLLLHKGADVNSNLHSEGYTALMFATVAGHPDTLELLLQAGARTTTENNVRKTATQLGAFVGQHACVRVINNFFSMKDLEYYTRPQGVEKTPKLQPSLAAPLHKLVTTKNLHPVKLIQALPLLLPRCGEVVRVLGILRDKMMAEERETVSLKMHYLVFLLQQCAREEGGPDTVVKRLLTMREDGSAVEMDKFLRQCLKEFPHVHSVLLKQMVATLAKTPAGEHPTALSMFHSAILGQKTDEELECCSTCGEYGVSLKKCSKCKQALYCGVECQRLAWTVGNHKKLCRKWAQKLEERESAEESKPLQEDTATLTQETSMQSQGYTHDENVTSGKSMPET